MLFPSEEFLYIFLPLTLALYFIIPMRFTEARNVILTLASLFFYAWGEEKNVLLLLGMALADWGLALILEKMKEGGLRKALFLLSVAGNLAALIWYKYAVFTIVELNRFFNAGIRIPLVILPIGISFFTFQAMSYVIDVYRGKYAAEKNPVHVVLYVAFFPQLIAGPIVRFEDIRERITKRHENLSDFSYGAKRFCIGLGKKVLLANQMALIADGVFALVTPEGFKGTVATAWLGAFAYMLQIFFDFAGYSDMAIGLGSMFGFRFGENFIYPFAAANMTEFWRRWHISLQTWFRDYVYIPMGGSRVKKSRWILNVFVVWLLTGIWHGANWTYVAWGLAQFAALLFENFTGLSKKKYWWGHIVTVMYFMFTVVVFRSTGLKAALRFILAMFGIGSTGIADGVAFAFLQQQGVWLLLAAVLSLPLIPALEKKFSGKKLWNGLYGFGVAAVFILCLSFIANNAYNPFIYFHF